MQYLVKFTLNTVKCWLCLG